MSSYPTDYRALPPGVTISPADHDLYELVRYRAGLDGSDTYDQLKAVRKQYPKASILAVAAALGGPETAAEHFG